MLDRSNSSRGGSLSQSMMESKWGKKKRPISRVESLGVVSRVINKKLAVNKSNSKKIDFRKSIVIQG